ncbi:MAG: response regulator [Chloroflexi bacterium]|nr:response regulator [Chloroflexota bacterium]
MAGVSQPRVLIVDDEPRNIRLLEGMLFGEPYHILTATTGQVALDIVRQEAPDLVLLDIMMPNLSGYDVCRQIKSMPERRMIPVVMVTALSDVDDRIKAIEAGADDFLSKPVDATELLARVRSLVKIRQLYRDVERITTERLKFMAGIAHDLRSPLNALDLSLNMLEEQHPATPATARQWSRIKTCIDRIGMLANDIMNFYRTESGKLELDIQPVPAEQVIAAAVEIVEPIAAEQGVVLDVNNSVDLDLPMDQHAITQVLQNLLTNGVKYTPAGGRVTVSTYALAQDAYHTYQLPLNHFPPVLALPVEGVVFEVQDTGQGIDPADFDRVFGEFDRLKATQEGIGLGLAVSQRLVRMHHGEIWFTSEPGIGSTFAFFLPR